MDKKELIFNMHKYDQIEDTIEYKNKLCEKYGLDEHESHDLFVKIINYQIEAYGSQLQKYNDYVSKDEYYHRNRNSKQREYERRRCR